MCRHDTLRFYHVRRRESSQPSHRRRTLWDPHDMLVSSRAHKEVPYTRSLYKDVSRTCGHIYPDTRDHTSALVCMAFGKQGLLDQYSMETRWNAHIPVFQKSQTQHIVCILTPNGTFCYTGGLDCMFFHTLNDRSHGRGSFHNVRSADDHTPGSL